MNRKTAFIITSLLLLSSIVGITSCNNQPDQNIVYRANNESSFKSFADSTDYVKVSAPGTYGDNFVYMKWLSRGATTNPIPIYTSSVKVLYKGFALIRFIREGNNTPTFDSNYNQEIRQSFQVSQNIPGIQIALQSMHVGDHIIVAIPWYLAYGTAFGINIPFNRYTALVYDIKLESVE